VGVVLGGSGAPHSGDSHGCGTLRHHDLLVNMTALSNMRLKLAAPVVGGRIAFVHRKVWRRSLGAIR
jgi:hypothetical protein